MSLGDVTGVQIWPLSKGWLIGSGAKCYLMADLDCSAGASQKENHQMELPDDLSAEGNLWSMEMSCGELQQSSFVLVAFWGSEHQGAFQCSWAIPVNDHFWPRLTCPWRRALSYHTQSACSKYGLSSLKQRFKNYFYRIPQGQQLLGAAVSVKTRADLALCQLVYGSK